MGVAAMVLGILGLLLCWVPGLGLLMSLLALIFGIIATVKKKKRGMGITGIVTGALGLTILPIVAAVAIPAFINYTKRAKTSEATTNLRSIAEGVTTHLNGEGPLETLGVEWTPSSVCCQEPGETCSEGNSEWDNGPWRAVGWRPHKPYRYQYRMVVDGDQLRIQARGDLDCDGIFSSYERTVTMAGAGAIVEDIVVENELE